MTFFTFQIVVFAVDVPITKGYTCILHHGSVQAAASVKKVAGTSRQSHRRSCSKHQETSSLDQRKQCSGRDCNRDPSVLGLVRQLQGFGQVHVTHWWKDHCRWNGCRHMMMQPNRLLRSWMIPTEACLGTFITLKGACGKTTTTSK